MRALAILLAAGSLGLGAAFLVACGESKGLISGADAGSVNGALDAVSNAIGNGNCRAANSAAADLRDQVASLPLTVDQRLRLNLAQGASTVSELAARDCRQTTPTTTRPQPTTTEPPTTTGTTPTTTETTTTQTTTETTPTTTKPPPTSPNGGGGAPSGGASPGGGAGSQ